MCCFKRLAVKMKRKAGWARGERTPAVTRPAQTEINKGKQKALKSSDRKERRRVAQAVKEEESKRNQFFQQKGWAT